MENLMLTQAIAGEALTSLGDLLHKMRFAWKIPQDCGCDNLKRLMKGRDYQSDNNVRIDQDNYVYYTFRVIIKRSTGRRS